MINIFLIIVAMANIITSNTFVINNDLNYRINIRRSIHSYKPLNIIQLKMNIDIDRRKAIKVIPLISVYSISKSSGAFNINYNDKLNIPKKVVVFGASGYTGGDTIRALLEKNISVVAVTRRKVEIVNRENAKFNSLVIDDLNKKEKITSIIADVINSNSINGIMKDVDAVIFCAASRPSIKVITTPGIDISKKNMKYQKITNTNFSLTAEPSNNVEDIGLVNVAEEAIRSNVKRLIIVSSTSSKNLITFASNSLIYSSSLSTLNTNNCKSTGKLGL